MVSRGRRLWLWLLSTAVFCLLSGITYLIMQWTSQEPLRFRVLEVVRDIDDSQIVHYEITNASAFPVYVVTDLGIRGISQRPADYGKTHSLTISRGMEMPTPFPAGANYRGVCFADKRTSFGEFHCYYRYAWVPTCQRYFHGFHLWAARWLPPAIEKYIPDFHPSRMAETGLIPIVSPPRPGGR